ncbi:hypothetical protein LTR10_003568 [Elasticomyces elasticus]|nr:hypothetical protein LTR10_003568 [Elasticomyces elasticus]KAK4978236.1 hypothetical protein LTR42_002614 [Elasticomyces elasticus]
MAVQALGLAIDSNSSSESLQVLTTSGLLNGFINAIFPQTRQFLGVPFALPPTGPRRWLPPVGFQSTASLLTNDIGPACPQKLLRNAQVYSVNGGNMTEFFPQETFSEDCLTLNIWTPLISQLQSAESELLPVIVWFFGGGFVQGGTNALYFNPESWVQRTQAHVVVTVNFRSNLFGFPNAAELTEQNLGLLDQRFALEWVRDNIARFGGDPSKIVKWGESAGAIACDFLNFAYPDDPIVHGMILDSGTALFPTAATVSFDKDYTNFTSIAEAVGCGYATSQLECMRTISWETLEGVMGADSSLAFLPIIDEKVMFGNYTERYAMGGVSSIPAIIGTNQHELNALIPQTGLNTPYNATSFAVLKAMYDVAANATFLCESAVDTSLLRQNNNLTTYRYRYDGNFPNISPKAYPGAFHAAELPLLFGTAGRYHGASTAYEEEVGRKMQDLWLAFSKDLENGLEQAGWGAYAEGKAVLLGGSDAPVVSIDLEEIDGACVVLGQM